jgi:hypothetical protein
MARKTINFYNEIKTRAQLENIVTASGGGTGSATFGIDFDAAGNNYYCALPNAANINWVFLNLDTSVIGKSGTIICRNNASVTSATFQSPAFPSTAFSPGGAEIAFNNTADAISVISYLIVLESGAAKVLINYVGKFQEYAG